MPDLRGLFLRGYGSQAHTQNNGSSVGTTSTTHTSGALKTVQGDSFRNSGAKGELEGTVYSAGGGDTKHNISWTKATGVFKPYTSSVQYTATSDTRRDTGSPSSISGVEFNMNNSLPTSNEIRPVNMAVRYLIRALP